MIRLPKHLRRHYSTRKRRKKRKPKVLSPHERHRRRLRKNATHIVWKRAQRLAKAGGWDFNLIEEDIVVPENCPALGIPIEIKSFDKDRSVSIDRLDSREGYIIGNVVIVSWRANRLKSDATPEELDRLADFYRGSTDRLRHVKVNFKDCKNPAASGGDERRT